MAAWRWLEDLAVRTLGWFGLSTTTARQLIRFVLVGLAAAAVYVAVMWLVVDRLGGRVLWGAFFAFVIATFVSFLGNALWSFVSRATPA
jgi:putative flippase GtrA